MRDGQRLPLGGPKPRAILAILLLQRNRVVAADRLVELLWGDESSETATHSLQVHISQLRKVLSAPVLESRPPGYLLHAADLEVDASQFEKGIGVAAQLRQAGKLDQAADALREALALWRGEPLADVAAASFAIAEVARLSELRLRSVEERLDLELVLGRDAELVAELEALLAQHPLRERLSAQLMLALYRCGRQAEASDVYYRTRKRLVDELGLEPGPLLQGRLKEILQQASSLEKPRALTVRPAPARAVRQALCPITVGRDQELGLLKQVLIETDGSGRLMLLTGEAGVGKTRLADEIHRFALERGMEVLRGGCSEAELALPYLPIVEALGNYLARIDLPVLRQRLGFMAPELAHLFPQLADRSTPTERDDMGQARLRLFEAILGLLQIAAEPAGLLLVIEDIHWADVSTRELLDSMVRRIAPMRMMILLTYRSDEVGRKHALSKQLQAWERARIATRVELEPLTANDVGLMVNAIFEMAAVSDDFRDFVHRRTAGNPFVVEEMLKSAIDRSDSSRTGLGREQQFVAELRIPSTVREAIVQRLAHLELPYAEVVRTAALLGQSFSYEALLAAAAAPEEMVRAALRECVQQQLIEAESDQRLRFRHALTQEAIYDDLLAPERVREHGRVADALQRLAGIPSAEIAEHLVRANRWEEAVPVLTRAAQEAEARRGYREAADLYARALDHVDDALVRAGLTCRLADAFCLAGEPATAAPLLQASLPVLEKAGQTTEAVRYRLSLGSCYWLAGRNEEAREQYEKARTILERGPASEPLAETYNRLALLAVVDLQMENGVAMANAAIATAEAAGAQLPRIWGYNFRGCGYVSLGETDRGFADLERSWKEGMELGFYGVAGDALSNEIDLKVSCLLASATLPLLERLGSIPDVVHAGGRLATWLCYRRAMAAVMLGDAATARAAAIDGLRLAQDAESGVVLLPALRSWLALAESALGRTDEARKLVAVVQQGMPAQIIGEVSWAGMAVYLEIGDLEPAIAIANRTLDYLERAPRLFMQDAWLADKAVEIFVAVGRLAEAERARLTCRTAPQMMMKPLSDRIEGRIASLRGDLNHAEQFLSSAVGFFEDHWDRREEWRTRRFLAGVKARQGNHRGAQRELEAVVLGAEEHGALYEASAARQQLVELTASAARVGRP